MIILVPLFFYCGKNSAVFYSVLCSWYKVNKSKVVNEKKNFLDLNSSRVHELAIVLNHSSFAFPFFTRVLTYSGLDSREKSTRCTEHGQYYAPFPLSLFHSVHVRLCIVMWYTHISPFFANRRKETGKKQQAKEILGKTLKS